MGQVLNLMRFLFPDYSSLYQVNKKTTRTGVLSPKRFVHIAFLLSRDWRPLHKKRWIKRIRARDDR